jgi:hypothetical protein
MAFTLDNDDPVFGYHNPKPRPAGKADGDVWEGEEINDGDAAFALIRNRLRGSVNVLEQIPSQYRAGVEAGTSSVDVRGWVQDTIDANHGREVTLPAGRYRLDSGPLVVNPAPGGSLLPTVIRGRGYDANGGNGGAYFTVGGESDGIQIVNSSPGSVETMIVLEGFGIYGDGTNTSGGTGIRAERCAGLTIRNMWVQGMRGNGIYLKDMWGGTLENVVILRNRLNGLYVDGRFNNGRLRRIGAFSNGRVYSQITANIYFTGGTGLESLSPILDNCDWSYSGAEPFHAKLGTGDGSIVSIVVSSNVATATTLAAHGLSAGNGFVINGAATSGLDSLYGYDVASTPTPTTFTFATSGVADGTYGAGTDPYLVVRPSAYGLILRDVHGAAIIGAYAEDTANNLIYAAANVKSLSIVGGYMQGQWVLVDNIEGGSLRGVRFAAGQRNASGKVGVFNNVPDLDVGGSCTFGPNTVFIPSTVQKRDGVCWSASAPSALAWDRGARVLNSAPAVGQPQGWVCTVGGSPGTWVPMPNL